MAGWRRVGRNTLTIIALVTAAARSQAAELSLTAAAPNGFADLESLREVVVDIYFGGRRLGEARALVRPGHVRFRDPKTIAELLAPYGDAKSIEQALSGDLPSNAGRACSLMSNIDCGQLRPSTVGIIFDEGRFRVDVFLSDQLANAPVPAGEQFLEPSSQGFTAVSSLGAAVSGANGDKPSFNLQTRTIVSIGQARLKSNLSYSSELGVIADDLLVEIDKPNKRYAAGLFWTPGTSLVGRQRLLGVSAASQYDSRADRELLEGTALPLFLQQPAVVEILIDGRLAASQVVEAGNQLLDTTTLPQGSYPLTLRIRESGRAVREERRFFIKDLQLAPEGQLRFQAFAGFITPTREGRLVSPSGTFFYQLGAAKRVTENLGVDVVALGTQQKAIAETGLVLLSKLARFRVAGLVSSEGEFGGLLQVSSTDLGAAQFSFDLRRVWGKDGGALIPGSFDSRGFDAGPGGGISHQGGDYTQVNATFGYRWGDASLRLLASYNDLSHSKADYSVGPSADWLAIQRSNFQLRLEADAQRSRGTTSTYAGVRFLFAGTGFAASGSAGHRIEDDHDRQVKARAVASMDAEWSGEAKGVGRYAIGAGLDRAFDASNARARGTLHSRLGSVRTDLLHDFGGRTQYGASIQTGAIFGSNEIAVGGHNISESALLIGVEGEGSAGQFEVLIDELPAAKLAAGQNVTLFLQPYRQYDIRLRPLSAAVHYDPNVRQVTLFPGNVEQLVWEAIPTFTIFGQVIDRDGRPIANAILQGGHGTGASNRDGYFQIDVAANDRVTLSSTSGDTCQLELGSMKPDDGYFAVGKVVCQ